MFNRSSGHSGKIDTLISHGTEIEGTIRCPGNLRIDGIFRGEIISKGIVVIGERGEAHSNISAKLVIVAGKVVGELKTEGRLTITSTGSVCGNSEAKYLVVQEGGILNGSSLIERPEPVLEQKVTEKQTVAKTEERKSKRDEKTSEKQAG